MFDLTSIYISFIAGLISFFSPCIFPLFPIYLTTLGLSNDISNKPNKIIIFRTLIFIISFSLIFLLLALTSTSVGIFLNVNKKILIKVSGVLIILFGLINIGSFKNFFLNKTYMINLNFKNKTLSPLFLG